jgi:hypothetical protein
MGWTIKRYEANDIYRSINNDGAGFSIGDDEATVEDVVNLMTRRVAVRARTTSDVYAVEHEDGGYVLIGGDGMGCAPWAVRCTEEALEAYRAKNGQPVIND